MALARLGHRTLCLDCDVGLRNLDIALVMTDRAVMDFTDVMEGRCSLEEAAAAHPQQKNLFLLTAPIRFEAADPAYRGIVSSSGITPSRGSPAVSIASSMVWWRERSSFFLHRFTRGGGH